ncbi:DNA topoisomerase 2-like [Triticum dicoccoides]|uniref:DNA topoisomerase 2-like n=1 Tax=Triticum dicoccoides TaxID=85692 RepID=UPI001890DD40|nr:DNA topoisomerase 2-like [Triticum dicoccoides]
MAEAALAIPSMVDGLRSGQRKVLFCALKRNLIQEATVAEFAGYVTEHSAFDHGLRQPSPASTIIGMAQDFVGSNNINLLKPRGQFGTRLSGGKYPGKAHHICTSLAPITRLIFPKDDDVLLNYLNEEGQSFEPSWYLPVIPMVLVNGCKGFGNGWSSHVPNYNPKDIIANLKRLLHGEAIVPMVPWYKGFKGSVKEKSSKAAGVRYTITGIIEEVDVTKLKITELPVRCWTYDYGQFLVSLCKGKDKEPPFLEEKGLEKTFKLTTTIGTTNMRLFDSDGKIRKYDSPEDILKEFFKLRLQFYGRREAVMLQNIGEELLKLKNKAKFIHAVISGDIELVKRKKTELILELKQKGYEPLPKRNITAEPVAVGGATEVEAEGFHVIDYEYLFTMTIGTFTHEKVHELIAQQKKLEDKAESLGKATPKTLWLRDLDALEKELDAIDAKLEEMRCRRQKDYRGEKVSEAAISAAKSHKASAPVAVRDDEDEVLELKECFSSPKHSAMEDETTQGEQKGQKRRNEPSKIENNSSAPPGKKVRKSSSVL